jgi:recombination protein RecA
MPSTSALRIQIESELADRIPSALTPAPRIIRPVISTGIGTIDDLLEGGLPVGAITELVGPECSGRTALALSFLAQITKEAKVCAWIDASNIFHAESAAAVGIDLTRLLWVRCGVPNTKEQRSQLSNFALPEKYLVPPPVKKGLHGGGFGPHPRGEVRGLSDAVSGLLHPEVIAPRCAEAQRRIRAEREDFEPVLFQTQKREARQCVPKPLSRADQALRVTDLLLQAGGFSAIVLDLGSIAPEFASRVPLATWFRYRAAAERTQASILLLTQHACAKSSAGLVLRMQACDPLRDETTVFTGIEHRIEISRERFTQPPINVIPLRKPPQSDRQSSWRSRTAWAGRR